MFEKLFKLVKPQKKDFKTLQFYKFALSIKAVEPFEDETDIDIKSLLSSSFEFLNQDTIMTKKQENELKIFKDRYNRYLEYAVENRFVKKDQFKKVEELKTFSVPDMSKIEVPDISKELEEMDINLDQLTEVFSHLGKK